MALKVCRFMIDVVINFWFSIFGSFGNEKYRTERMREMDRQRNKVTWLRLIRFFDFYGILCCIVLLFLSGDFCYKQEIRGKKVND